MPLFGKRTDGSILNDCEGDDEVWHSDTYQVSLEIGKTPLILITIAGVMNLGIVKFVQRVQ